MIKFDRQLTFSTNDYADFEEMVDELLWNDMYLHQDDTFYIHDSNQDVWYSIERRFHYGDIQQLFREKQQIRFDEVKDEDIIDDLKETFYS